MPSPSLARRLAALALDGASGAVCLAAGVDLLRGLLLGAERTDPWVIGGPLPLVAAGLALVLAGAVGGGRLRAARTAGFLLLALLALGDAWTHLRWVGAGGVGAAWPVSLSLVLGGVLLLAAARPSRARARLLARVVALGVAAPLLVLLHLATFGGTDYRRPADVALVFGAKVDERGEASGALFDRVITACRLYEAGLVDHLLLSGGRNPAVPASEPEVMARLALARGIPESALILDERGMNTEASVRGAARLCRERGWERALAVSHDVHLARVRMLARRAGLDLRTVPARETVEWPMKYVFVSREVAAWSWWYARSLFAALRD